MLVNLLNICSDDELMCTDTEDLSEFTDAMKGKMTEEQINELKKKRQSEKAKLQKKILGIGRMARHFQQMREDAEKSMSNFSTLEYNQTFQTYSSRVSHRPTTWMVRPSTAPR